MLMFCSLPSPDLALSLDKLDLPLNPTPIYLLSLLKGKGSDGLLRDELGEGIH